MLNCGVSSWVYGEITELRRNYGIRKADSCSRTPPGAMLRWPFRYHCSFMYAAVSDISYIAESVASWEKESDLVAKLWASNIRFGYCTILTVTQKHAQQQMSVCMSLLSATRFSMIRGYTLHQTG